MKRKSLAARIRNYSLALGSGFRSKRITPLLDMIMRVTRENGRCSIIDIGGTREYWSIIPKDFLVNNRVSVTVVNVAPAPSIHASEAWFTYVHGDGCNLQHLDKSFDIAHSNSVIEHVGTWDSMVKFSKEIDRVSFGYFVQTPNYWFPWEPHFGTPCFQFLPVPLKVSLLMAGERGFFDRMPTIDAAMRAIESCELLDERRFRSLFNFAARFSCFSASLFCFFSQPRLPSVRRRRHAPQPGLFGVPLPFFKPDVKSGDGESAGRWLIRVWRQMCFWSPKTLAEEGVSMAGYVLRRLLMGSRLRKIWIERLTEPVHLNLASMFVGMFGSYRSRVAFDLIIRQQYAYPILRAADQALEYGISKLTIIEFGVASGAGLLNMCRIAERTSRATGVQFRVIGFDTGAGMPAPADYRDHPEQWQQGDYPMEVEKLHGALPSNAELIIGDVANTLPPFLQTISAEQPVGFIAVDVDYYSSAKSVLRVFSSDAEKYLPATLVYLDDIDHICSNQWAGELLAVSEFNSESELRKIAPFAMLRSLRIFKNPQWIDHMYIAHVHDHALRSPQRKLRAKPFVIDNEYI